MLSTEAHLKYVESVEIITDAKGGLIKAKIAIFLKSYSLVPLTKFVQKSVLTHNITPRVSSHIFVRTH